MRRLINFLVLAFLKVVAMLFYRFDVAWVGEPPKTPWGPYRLLAILNHTSLFEWLYVGMVPLRFIWRIAGYGLVPTADITLKRPFVGSFFKILAPHVVPITRQADRTWKAVIDRAAEDVMIIILPEGRMKRANGLDKYGQPMTVRGGIADILRAIPGGAMLVAYSGGLHHVQVPGQKFPRLFQKLTIRLEEIDINAYKQTLEAESDRVGFKDRVKLDLEHRRDTYCSV